MKKLVIVFMMLLISVVSAQAQMGSGMEGGQKEQPCQGMKMDEEMMQHMMSHKMMMQDIMQMMMEMMNMQEKMMKGPKAAEKKQMMKDMAQMKEKMQKMMSVPMGMMGTDDPQSKLACARQWLKKAIDLQEIQLKDPTSATEESQMEQLDQMERAYECIAGTDPGMSGMHPEEAVSNEPKNAEPAEAAPHKQ